VRQPRDCDQPTRTADELDALDDLLKSAWTDFAAGLDAAADSSAALAGIYAKAAVMDGGRR
jgi:hypothetical protein